MTKDETTRPVKPEDSDYKKKYDELKTKFDNLIKKYNNLCDAIDGAGYSIMAMGKLNKIKNE